MLSAQSVLEGAIRPADPAPRIPKIVKLVLNARDLDEPISLTMYNVVREGLSAAGKVLEKGGTVGLELQDAPDSPVRHRLLSSVRDLDEWRDAVNRLTVLCHPTPRIQSL
jgi:hypothetical protein